MTQEKTLVLEFWDEDSNVKSLKIKNPKEDLTIEFVTEVMNTIIEKDALMTNAGKHFTDISNCYYRTIIVDNLGSAEAGE